MRSIGDQTVQFPMTRLPGLAPQTARSRPAMNRSLGISLPVAVRNGGTFAGPEAPNGAWPGPASAAAAQVSPSCGLPGLPDATPEQLSSSSLPPSLAPGRRTAAFLPGGFAQGGATFFMAGAPR